ncbi:MAG: cytidylate kinase family protein [Candidatus Aenigmatarchaeota archaeon]
MVVIVISGMPGCGSSTTAKLLAKKLALKYFSVGKYYKRFEEGKETERAIKFMQSRKGFGKKFNFWLDRLQVQKAKKGNIVIESKVGIKILKNIYDFSVWLEAPINIRIRRIAKRDRISLEEAKKKLIKKEKLERKKFKSIYGFDFLKQKYYADLVINTGDKTPNKIVNKIIEKFKKRKITIAISGQSCSGSTTIVNILAKKLKLKTFIPGDKFKGKIKTGKSAIDIWKGRGESKKFHQSLDRIQIEKAKKGNIIIGGKLSVHLLSDIADFTVWLFAKKSVRIERLSKRDKIDKKEAKKILEEKEKIERNKWKKFYGFDYFKQKYEADLSINTDNKKPEKIAEIILNEMKKRKIILDK